MQPFEIASLLGKADYEFSKVLRKQLNALSEIISSRRSSESNFAHSFTLLRDEKGC